MVQNPPRISTNPPEVTGSNSPALEKLDLFFKRDVTRLRTFAGENEEQKDLADSINKAEEEFLR